MTNLKFSIIGLLVFLLLQNTSFAQQSTVKTISNDEFNDSYIYRSFTTGIPTNELPKGVTDAYIYLEDGGRTAALIYKYADNYKMYPKIKIDFSYNDAKGNGAEYKNGEITVSSQIPFSETTISGYFKISGNKLIFLRKERYDPGAENADAADKALADGDIKKAAELYMETMYPPMGFFEYTHKVLLKRAYEVAKKQFKNKQYKKACETMGYAYDFIDTDWDSDIYDDKEIVNIIANYTYFLDKAKMYKKCAEVSEMICNSGNNVTGPFMHLGDAYYHTNKKKEALKAYKTYSEKRTKQGKTVPSYVKNRIKELSPNSNTAWDNFIAGCNVIENSFLDIDNVGNLPRISDQQEEILKKSYPINGDMIIKPIVFRMPNYYFVLFQYVYEGPNCFDLYIFDKKGKQISKKEGFIVGSTGSRYSLQTKAKIRSYKNNTIRISTKEEEYDDGEISIIFRYYTVDKNGKISKTKYAENKTQAMGWYDFLFDLHIAENHKIHFSKDVQKFNKSPTVKLPDDIVKYFSDFTIEAVGIDETDTNLSEIYSSAKEKHSYFVGCYATADNMTVYFIYSFIKYTDSSSHRIDAFAFNQDQKFIKAINVYYGSKIDTPLLIDKDGDFIINIEYQIGNLKIELKSNGNIEYYR